MSNRKSNNQGFTYIDVLVSISIIFIMITILMQLNQYNHRLSQKLSDTDKMTAIAEGIMNIYRVQGKDAALSFADGYIVDITEDTNTGYSNLNKVILKLSSANSELSPITLITFDSTYKSSGSDDTTPPAEVLNLAGELQFDSYILLTWTNPTDSDFSKVKIYADGVYCDETSENSYEYYDLGYASIEFIVKTVDASGNESSGVLYRYIER